MIGRAEPVPPVLALLLQHMVAGAAAGIGEHVAMYPVDTVKTRMQALAHPGQQVSLQWCLAAAAADTNQLAAVGRQGLHGALRHFSTPLSVPAATL